MAEGKGGLKGGRGKADLPDAIHVTLDAIRFLVTSSGGSAALDTAKDWRYLQMLQADDGDDRCSLSNTETTVTTANQPCRVSGPTKCLVVSPGTADREKPVDL